MKRLLAAIPPGALLEGFIEAVMGRTGEIRAEVRALYTIDSLWFRYSSTDWLSTGPSRARYEAYMRDTLRAEGERLTGELRSAAQEAGVGFSSEIAEGDPVETAVQAAISWKADEIITTSNYPDLELLLRKSVCTVIVYTPGATGRHSEARLLGRRIYFLL